MGYITDEEAKAYVRNQAIGPLVNRISLEVEKTKKVNHNDPKARIEAARKLVTNTKEAFSQLKSILPISDSQYQMQTNAVWRFFNVVLIISTTQKMMTLPIQP